MLNTFEFIPRSGCTRYRTTSGTPWTPRWVRIITPSWRASSRPLCTCCACSVTRGPETGRKARLYISLLRVSVFCWTFSFKKTSFNHLFISFTCGPERLIFRCYGWVSFAEHSAFKYTPWSTVLLNQCVLCLFCIVWLILPQDERCPIILFLIYISGLPI